MRRNTIDIDNKPDKEFLRRVVYKILRCQFLDRLYVRFSSSLNGYHLILWCYVDCDLCRLVFDDQYRFRSDLSRPIYTRDVLFKVKKYITVKELFNEIRKV